MNCRPDLPVPRRSYLAGAANAALAAGWLGGDLVGGDGTEPGNGNAGASGTDDASDSRVDPTTEPVGESVLVDQVGYRPGDRKIGVVRADASTFSVLDSAGEVVASGDLSEPVADPGSGDVVRHAEFSDLTEPGEYVLAVGDGSAVSHPFAVGEDVWSGVLEALCRRYTLRRSDTSIADPETGLDIEAGHTRDREARLYFSDGFHEEGERLDVSGGWYDAGDYGKYVPPAAITVAQLLLAYELYPRIFADGQLSFPDGVSSSDPGTPDLLAELRYELEWLERMQRPDGAVYHKVAGREWPGFVRPAADDQPRYVFGLSTFGTALYAGTMALAVRVFAEYDAAFADRLLANARAAQGFLADTPEPMFRHDDGQDDGSGPYRKETDAEERFWAAAELLKTTGDPGYAAYLHRELPDQFRTEPAAVSWDDALLLGQWAYYTADAGDRDRSERVAGLVRSAAAGVLERVERSGYNVALRPGEYTWASTRRALARGVLLLLADGIEPDPTPVAAAADQVHYALGRTPTATTYVTGVGEEHPEEPHSRLAASTGVDVPGDVVGGPNASGGDGALAEYVEAADPPPAKRYLDDRESYASNEPAIDYAAPLVFAIAGVSERTDP